jgi:hypothetical protein
LGETARPGLQRYDFFCIKLDIYQNGMIIKYKYQPLSKIQLGEYM